MASFELGFAMLYGGEDEGFTSFKAASNFVNLLAQPAARQWSWRGRVIFYHSDVDGLYARLVAAGYRIETPPRDAEWGERFFHITDPDGHELSFARPLKQRGNQVSPSDGRTVLSAGLGESKKNTCRCSRRSRLALSVAGWFPAGSPLVATDG